MVSDYYAWRDHANELDARIEELKKESAQWQESCGQNYVRATEAEMREEKKDQRIKELEEAIVDAKHRLHSCRTWGGMDWSWHPIHAKTAHDILCAALEGDDE